MLVGGSQSRGVWGLKSTNVPGPKNSGTGKMIHFLDWFLVPFFSGIWMSIFRGGIWIFIILKKFITILDGSDSLELNWGYRQSLGIDDRRQWSIYPVGICFSLTSKTFVGSSHEVCINLRWSEMIHQRWFQMWSSVHTHIHIHFSGGVKLIRLVAEIEKTINRSYHVPKMMDPYVKSQSQVGREQHDLDAMQKTVSW